MRPITLFIVCGAALLAASPALAQDYDDEGVLPDTAADIFSGPHIELGAGFDHINIKSYKNTDTTQNISSNKTGLSYGGALGYDLPLTERMTLGVEATLQSSSNRWTNGNLTAGNFNTAQVKVGTDVSVGLRLGYAFSKKTQVFGKLGYAYTHFGVTGTDGSETLYNGFSANGARLGVGVEQHLTRAIYVKLEYDRTQYSGGTLTYLQATPDGSLFTLDNARDQLTGSVGLRF